MRNIWERVDLEGLSQATFKRFVALLYHLITEQQLKFDLVLAGGNTGWAMVRLTQMIYTCLVLESPPVIKTYPQRYKPGTQETGANLFDNSILELDVRNQIIDCHIDTSNVRRVLFVDDEIAMGTTARVCLELLLKNIPAPERRIDYYIVAEDQGFQGLEAHTNVEVIFRPFAREVAGMNNVITYFPPYDIAHPLMDLFDDGVIRLNILLGLPTRDKTRPLAGFTYWNNRAAKEHIAYLDQLSEQFAIFVHELIRQGIDEYRKNEIDLGNFDYVNQFIEGE